MKYRNDGYYYNFMDDLKNHPDTWCYIIFGGRNTGKTYSVLKAAVETNKIFVYVKRTKEDIKLICAGGTKKTRDMGIKADFSPFVSLNRDLGWNIKPFMLNDDIGIFCHCDSEDKPVHGKDPVGYCLSLSLVTKYKGFDLSYCHWLIFDEFCPKIYERKLKAEGESIMELYKTISRDREHRDLPALKLIGLANADNAASPLTDILEVTDQIVKMSKQKQGFNYDPDRDILIRRLIDNKSFREKEAESRIYKAMKNTKWAAMALDNDFGFNDFSQVNKINLKRYNPLCKVKYKNDLYYLYVHPDNGIFYFTNRRFNTESDLYDLNTEADVKRFFYEYVVRLQEASREHRCIFETYTLSRIIWEYKKIFDI